jgi:hypothetical protein
MLDSGCWIDVKDGALYRDDSGELQQVVRYIFYEHGEGGRPELVLLWDAVPEKEKERCKSD